MSSSQRGARSPGLSPSLRAANTRRPGGAWSVLIGGSLAGAAAVAGGVAAAGALSAEWSARAADAAYAACIALALIAAARAAGTLSGDGPPRYAARRGAAAWGAIGAIAVSLAAVLAALAGGIAVRGDTRVSLALVPGTLLLLLSAAGEEVYLRGWFMPALARRWGAAWGIALSSLLFALLHMLGGARAPLTLVNMGLGGVLFGLLAWRGGGIATSLAVHFGWNWGEAILLGLDPNPGVGSYGAVLNLDLTGARWLGGSDEGLNASLPMTAMLLVMLALAARWRPAAAGAAPPAAPDAAA